MNTWSPLVRRCLELGARAVANGDVPVGALIVPHASPSGPILVEAWNRREDPALPDPTAHAEILALRAAAQLKGRWRLTDCTLVVSLEPCIMCAGAILAARIPRVVFGAWDPLAGACGSTRDVVRDPRLNHRVEVIGGILSEAAAAQLQEFFAKRRV